MYEHIPQNPYLLLTPGPLSTSKGVRNALLRDWCTWDDDYNEGVVQQIRRELISLAASRPADYTAVLMQGSGSFGVEACLGTATRAGRDKLLVIANGAYGMRMAKTLAVMGRAFALLCVPENEQPRLDDIEQLLRSDAAITHVAMVHGETTTGILNPLDAVCALAKQHGKTMIIDAMSTFGGMPIDMSALDADFLISSSNKCIQGVAGFSFIIAKTQVLSKCEGNAHSHSLDAYDQWKCMDAGGKWRFTSPTHVVRAFQQALFELSEEGGVAARYARYSENQRMLVQGMAALGYPALLPRAVQSPIITSFVYPRADFSFMGFYVAMKRKGFVLYPGKVSCADTFRIGNIGDVYPQDIEKLLKAIEEIGT